MNSMLGSFLEDNNGGFSAMRLSLMLWVIGVLVMWIVSAFQNKSGGLPEIPSSVITILGILAGSKAVQRFGEK